MDEISKSWWIGSLIREFFTTLKKLDSIGLDNFRLFFTGISPIFLNDISGFNHFADQTNDPLVSNMLGFTEADVKRGLKDACGYGDEMDLAAAYSRCFSYVQHF